MVSVLFPVIIFFLIYFLFFTCPQETQMEEYLQRNIEYF